MARHNQLGREGEDAAVRMLLSKGLVLLHRNWTCGKLEIDIIARKDQTLVFAEVKTRATDQFGLPEEAVDGKKIRKMVNAADVYIRLHNWEGDVRFDIISLIPDSDYTFRIDHIEDAFYPPIF